MAVKHGHNTDMKRQINVFGSKCLHSMMGFSWSDFVSNQQLLHESESRTITNIVCQCELRLYRHVAHYPEADPASWVVSERDNMEWRQPKGCPQSSWLGLVDVSCWELACSQLGS